MHFMSNELIKSRMKSMTRTDAIRIKVQYALKTKVGPEIIETENTNYKKMINLISNSFPKGDHSAT